MQGHHEGPALRKILNVADSLKNLVGIPQTSSATNLQDNHIPPLDLPFPNDILEPLASIGLPDHLLQRISNTILACIDKSTRTHLSNYEESCKTLLALPPVPGSLPLDVLLAKLRTIYQNSYMKRNLSWIKSQVNDITVAWRQRPSNKKRKPFNYEYIPLLEEYFKYKAYPSGPDRHMLARKCAMTPRQIEVWFQNHRNRSRKDGTNKPLQRVQADIDLENLEVPLRSLEEKMPLFTNPVCERKSQDLSKSLSDNEKTVATVVTEANIVDVLDIPAASHAYPVVYKPAASNNPPHTIKFLPPTWVRRPATATASSNAVVDVDHIIEQFSRLHLRDPSRKHLRRNNVTDIELLRSGKRCWFASRFVIPPITRHPAFVPTHLPVMSPSVPLVGSTTSPLAETVNRGRKIAGFPKRTPTDTRCSRRIGPVLSRPSPSRHRTGHSRSSSLSSTSSFDTRSVSSSSSISTAPSTPSSSPHTLSHTGLPSMSPTCSIETADDFHTLHSIIQQNNFQHGYFSEYSTGTQGLTLPMLSFSFKPSGEYTHVHT